MRTILVAVDESDASQRVVQFVNRFFDGLDVSVLAVSVAARSATWMPASTPYGWVYAWPALESADAIDELQAQERARADARALFGVDDVRRRADNRYLRAQLGAGMPNALTNNAEQSRYELSIDGRLVGVADYRVDGHRVVFPHTEIEESMRGNGLGAELVRYALDDVQAAGRQVVAHCWYVAQFIDENPEYRRLLAS